MLAASRCFLLFVQHPLTVFTAVTLALEEVVTVTQVVAVVVVTAILYTRDIALMLDEHPHK